MIINLLQDLERPLREEVISGHFASLDDAMAEAVRRSLLERRHEQAASESGPYGLGSIGAVRDSANELDEVVADAMKKRREETWRAIRGE